MVKNVLFSDDHMWICYGTAAEPSADEASGERGDAGRGGRGK